LRALERVVDAVRRATDRVPNLRDTLFMYDVPVFWSVLGARLRSLDTLLFPLLSPFVPSVSMYNLRPRLTVYFYFEKSLAFSVKAFYGWVSAKLCSFIQSFAFIRMRNYERISVRRRP
jgi:hypothetical protein